MFAHIFSVCRCCFTFVAKPLGASRVVLVAARGATSRTSIRELKKKTFCRQGGFEDTGLRVALCEKRCYSSSTLGFRGDSDCIVVGVVVAVVVVIATASWRQRGRRRRFSYIASCRCGVVVAVRTLEQGGQDFPENFFVSTVFAQAFHHGEEKPAP